MNIYLEKIAEAKDKKKSLRSRYHSYIDKRMKTPDHEKMHPVRTGALVGGYVGGTVGFKRYSEEMFTNEAASSAAMKSKKMVKTNQGTTVTLLCERRSMRLNCRCSCR